MCHVVEFLHLGLGGRAPRFVFRDAVEAKLTAAVLAFLEEAEVLVGGSFAVSVARGRRRAHQLVLLFEAFGDRVDCGNQFAAFFLGKGCCTDEDVVRVRLALGVACYRRRLFTRCAGLELVAKGADTPGPSGTRSGGRRFHEPELGLHDFHSLRPSPEGVMKRFILLLQSPELLLVTARCRRVGYHRFQPFNRKAPSVLCRLIRRIFNMNIIPHARIDFASQRGQPRFKRTRGFSVLLHLLLRYRLGFRFATRSRCARAVHLATKFTISRQPFPALFLVWHDRLQPKFLPAHTAREPAQLIREPELAPL
mmetsp:Transcript_24681/g.62016  ORF Transcript_24681/g.62016 Transcript_24681/m.62016 type:complete len:309 (+) Transcript_24681:1659-2585(+)